MKTALLLSCEHYSNEVPAALESLFKGNRAVLQTHRAYDIGAAHMFDALESLASKSYKADRSRLLIELNRSLHHPKLFSEFMQAASDSEKKQLKDFYLKYRSEVEKGIESLISKEFQVIHVGVHSFTPVMDGITRNADIGLLYDPSRSAEKDFCAAWKKSLKEKDSSLRIRYNYPYLGKADGFTTSLRKGFKEKQYAGIELEVNQAFFKGKKGAELIEVLKSSLQQII
jgi:predicted N-formylglutamate amidohydrolase